MSHQVADASLSADSVSHVESNGEALPPNWETSIPAIPVDQQYTLLAAAVKRISQRSRPASDINGERARSFFSPLLAGQSATLPPAPATPFQPVDCELDEGQLLAIAGALHSPDVYLIAGLPGTGKSRVLAELIRQATRQGQRVLFCSPTPAGLDAVLAEGAVSAAGGDADAAAIGVVELGVGDA